MIAPATSTSVNYCSDNFLSWLCPYLLPRIVIQPILLSKYFLPDTASYKRAPGSFLFSLVNASGLPPTKMPLIDGKEGNAIYCHNSRGPVFGGGHDLCVPDSPNSSNCSVNLGITYQCPAGQNGNLFLTGSQYFVVNEMEVFVLKN